MAVVNVQSTQISNAESTPPKMNDYHGSGAKVRLKAATVEKAAADSANSTYRMFRVNSADVISELNLRHDAAGAGATALLGLYDIEKDGGAAVDDNLFATAYNDSAAGSADLRYDTLDINTMGQKVWELLGLTEDPQKQYDVVVKLGATPGANACTFSLEAKLVDGS